VVGRALTFEPFKLEHFFARWEFTAPYLLCSSDLEALSLRELLALADEETSRLWQDLRLGYTETLGHPLLRREIAGLYDGVRAEDVIVFSGAQEPIFVAMSVLLGPGDQAIVVTPTYQSLYSIPRGVGAEVSLVALDPERGWSLDLHRVASAVTARTRVIVLNVPNSPTGSLVSRETFASLVALARQRGIVLFCDEVYRWLEYDEAGRLPAGVEAFERGLSLGVMSKAFGLAGLRIGWIATRDADLLRRLAEFKHYTTICNSGPSEILALMGLRARAALLARARGIIQTNLDRLDRFFADWRGTLEWTRPRAGTIAFPRFVDGTSIDSLASELVEKRGVLILPGSIFDWPGAHFRIGFGRKNMPEALARFEEFLGTRRTSGRATASLP
jgi:aspartate/methionine/tyrosine aminotransferase